MNRRSPYFLENIHELKRVQRQVKKAGQEFYVISKPENDKIKYKGLRTRLYHAWLVFRCKATAFQYYEDKYGTH